MKKWKELLELYHFEELDPASDLMKFRNESWLIQYDSFKLSLLRNNLPVFSLPALDIQFAMTLAYTRLSEYDRGKLTDFSPEDYILRLIRPVTLTRPLLIDPLQEKTMEVTFQLLILRQT